MNPPVLPSEPTEMIPHSASIFELKTGSNGEKNLKIMLGLTFELSFPRRYRQSRFTSDTFED